MISCYTVGRMRVMNWDKIHKCKHKWTDYLDNGSCGTPHCYWTESHCRKCGIYVTECGCGSMNGMSGEPYKKEKNRRLKRRNDDE